MRPRNPVLPPLAAAFLPRVMVVVVVAAAIAAVAVSGVAFAQEAAAPAAPATHADLDWKAPNLWVHVDNVDAQKALLFENARLAWLKALRRDGALLGDGRALFWQARRSPAGQTFFSFYPFADWPGFEARRQMAAHTQEVVGKEAVTAYDAGDAALVSPHYSQVWRRVMDFDITSPRSSGLNELTAGYGRLEIHDVDITRWDEYEGAWRDLAGVLRQAGYPLARRCFRSSLGRGECQAWWLAPDAATYQAAPPVADVLRERLGEDAAKALLATLDAVFPLRESYEVERRGDLCNLGR